MKHLLSLVIVVALLAVSVSAAEYTFAGWEDDKWETVGNWWPTDSIPGAGDMAWIQSASGVVPVFDAVTGDQTVAYLSVGYRDNVNGTNYLNMSGGSLTVVNEAAIGALWAPDGNNAGVLNMSGGTLRSSSMYFVGQHTSGTINLTGGNTGGTWVTLVGSQGTVNLNGGTFEATQWLNMEAGGSIVIGGDGELIAGGVWTGMDAAAQVFSYIEDGLITAAPGLTLEFETYDSFGQYGGFGAEGDYGIRVWAVPEPATMLLFGLGGLVLRRRRG